MKCRHPYCDDYAYIGERYCLEHLKFLLSDEADSETDIQPQPGESKNNNNDRETSK